MYASLNGTESSRGAYLALTVSKIFEAQFFVVGLLQNAWPLENVIIFCEIPQPTEPFQGVICLPPVTTKTHWLSHPDAPHQSPRTP